MAYDVAATNIVAPAAITRKLLILEVSKPKLPKSAARVANVLAKLWTPWTVNSRSGQKEYSRLGFVHMRHE